MVLQPAVLRCLFSSIMFSNDECLHAVGVAQRKLSRATLEMALLNYKMGQLKEDIDKIKDEVARLSSLVSRQEGSPPEGKRRRVGKDAEDK